MPACAPAFFPAQLDQYGPQVCLIDAAGVAYSYATVLERADSWAAQLGPLRQLVFIEGRNSVASIAAYIGSLRAGHVVHLVDPDKPEAATALASTYQAHVLVRCPLEADTAEIERLHNTPLALHPDLAVLLSTSGSTGAQKLVKLSWQNLQANTVSILSYLEMQPSDRAITTLKPHYSFGLSIINTHLAIGGSLVLCERSLQDPSFWAQVKKEAPTNFSGVPYSFELMKSARITLEHYPSLRFITQAGGRLAPNLVQDMAQHCKAAHLRFYVMYGQTEAAPRMSYLPPDQVETYPDCIGIAIPNGTLFLKDETGARLTTRNTEGELFYSGPNVMMGYALTAADLATKEDLTELATGDLALQNEAGLFKITGRKARFVKPFGIRTSLDDLEQHLEQHQLSARVVGIDQHIVACTTTSASEADIIAALVKKSGLPAAFFAVKQMDDFPRLPTGKIDYKKLHALALYDVLRPLSVAEVMAMFIRRTLQESLSILTGHGATWQSVAEIFQIHFPAHTILPTDSFASLSGDSLIHVQVSLALEDYLGHLPHNWHTLSLLDLEKLHG